jgi:hypothetical protein
VHPDPYPVDTTFTCVTPDDTVETPDDAADDQAGDNPDQQQAA